MVSGETRSSSEGRSGNRARHSLLVVQVALVLVLLVASGLMMRTFATLRRVDPGFRDQAQVQTFQLTIPAAAMTDASRTGALAEDILRMQHAIVDRLAAVAGVGSAAFSSSNDGLPLDGDGRTTALFVEGRSAAGPLTSLKEVQLVSPQFFETLRTPLLAGRTFDWNDVHHSRRVALVSENLARAEWGTPAAALGQRVGTGRTGPWSEVVGVVQDVHHDGLNLPAPETVIFPASARNGTASFVIRSERVGTAGFLDDLRAAVWSVNPDLSPANVQTLGDLYQRSMARTAMSLQLLAVTGTLALVLGLIGIYGTVSYAVAQRHREIGIRLALGAGHGAVRRMFVRQALAVTSVGIALGLGAAAGLTGLMGSQLFGVTPLDPLTHLVVSISVLAAAGLASDLSARRASAFDPVEILKGP